MMAAMPPIIAQGIDSYRVRHPFFHSSRPLVFAHRGGAALAPENTMAAFDRAVSLGVDGLELDVRLSSDGEVVVHHDRTLERTTSLRGPVAERTAGELNRVGVPTLRSVFDRHRAVRVIVEMKINRAEFGLRVVDVVRAAGAIDRVCLGSFGGSVMRTVRSAEPAIATSAAREEVRRALYRSWCRCPVARARYGGYQVPEHAGRTRIVSPRFVHDAHRFGLAVQVWTVNGLADARRLLDWGVDALISDRPDLMVPLVHQEGPA
jgi:glycerophosphoryl diester phosphodiesterase